MTQQDKRIGGRGGRRKRINDKDKIITCVRCDRQILLPRKSSHLLTKSRGRGTLHCLSIYSTPVQKYPRAASFKDLILSYLICLYKMPNKPIPILLDLCEPLHRGLSFFFRQDQQGEPWTTCSNKRIPRQNCRAVQNTEVTATDSKK